MTRQFAEKERSRTYAAVLAAALTLAVWLPTVAAPGPAFAMTLPAPAAGLAGPVLM